jgi:hypothetical protein
MEDIEASLKKIKTRSTTSSDMAIAYNKTKKAFVI